jgi:hypothetical protein
LKNVIGGIEETACSARRIWIIAKQQCPVIDIAPPGIAVLRKGRS